MIKAADLRRLGKIIMPHLLPASSIGVFIHHNTLHASSIRPSMKLSARVPRISAVNLT